MSDETLDPDLLDDDLPSPEALRRKQRNRMLLVGLAIFGVLAAIGVYVYLEMTKVETEPNKVLVLIEATDSQGTTYRWWTGGDDLDVSEAWSTELALELEDLGLKAVPFEREAREALAEVDSPDALVEAARKLGAAYVVRGRIETVGEMPLSSTTRVGFVYELDIKLVDTDENATIDVLAAPVRYIASGRTEGDAMRRRASDHDVYLPHLAGAIVDSPGMQALMAGGAEVTLEHKEIANELETKLVLYADDWDRRFGEREEALLEAEEHTTQDEQSTNKRSTLGPFVGQEDLVGSRADGSVVLLREMIQYGFDWPPGEVTADVTIEQLIAADAHGQDRRYLVEHDNFFSTQSLSPDGGHLAVVLAEGRTKTLARLSLDGGTVDSLAVATDGYFGSPTIADGGRYVLTKTYDSQYNRRETARLELLDADTKERRTIAQPGDFWSYPAWVPGKAVAYLSLRQAFDDHASIYRYDVEADELTPVLGAARDAQLAEEALDDVAETAPGTDDTATPVGDATAAPETTDDATADAAPEGDDADTDGEALPDDALAMANPDDPFAAVVPVPEPPPVPEFGNVIVSPTGDFAIVQELIDGTNWLGRLDLATGEYTRIVELTADYLVISPDGKQVALQLSEHGDSRDPRTGDPELAVMPVAGGELQMLTLNSAEDFLRAWSADGKAVYGTRYAYDPGFNRQLSRVHRIEVE